MLRASDAMPSEAPSELSDTHLSDGSNIQENLERYAHPKKTSANDVSSSHGNVDCGGYHCANPQAKAPTPCKKDVECQLPKDAPIGGLPYICLTDVKFCGWQDLSKKETKGK